jgi:glycosyltransferase involved in cell wall biosynthesis
MNAARLGNAAIRFHSSAVTGGPRLMGMQAANEGFIRAFARHAEAETIHCLIEDRAHADQFAKIVQAQRPGAKIRAVHQRNLAMLADPGCVSWLDPTIARVAWRRRRLGARSFSLCGLTHTVSSSGTMEHLGRLLMAPLQPWDALVCTSDAVRRAVEELLGQHVLYLKERFATAHVPTPALATIPLGVDCDALKRDGAPRAKFRNQLGIAEADIAVLFVGRLSYHAKANPYPMYAALERAAAKAGRQLHLIQAGWFANAEIEKGFREGAGDAMPSVKAHFLDGRAAEVRAGIWSAGDIFCSLSDNVQETFGLAPVEAMAAGLPGVVSDWNGYKDTVRDGEDGFRVPTIMPAPGAGEDLADRLFAGVETYDRFIGAASQAIAVDIDATAAALEKLIADAGLRRHFGEAAETRARAVFDWRVVIRRHQELWAELAERRKSAPEWPGAVVPPGAAANPLSPDPFAMFANYPSDTLTPGHRVALVDGEAASAALKRQISNYCGGDLLTLPEVAAMVQRLSQGEASVEELAKLLPAERRAAALRGVAWLIKYGAARIAKPR